MPSTYTPILRVTKPATGEQSGTWGGTVNNEITSNLICDPAGYSTGGHGKTPLLKLPVSLSM